MLGDAAAISHSPFSFSYLCLVAVPRFSTACVPFWWTAALSCLPLQFLPLSGSRCRSPSSPSLLFPPPLMAQDSHSLTSSVQSVPCVSCLPHDATSCMALPLEGWAFPTAPRHAARPRLYRRRRSSTNPGGCLERVDAAVPLVASPTRCVRGVVWQYSPNQCVDALVDTGCPSQGDRHSFYSDIYLGSDRVDSQSMSRS